MNYFYKETNQKQSIVTEENDQQNKKQVEIKYYKYGLPIPNLDPEFKGIDNIYKQDQEEKETPNTRLFDLLQLNEKSPYEQYELQLKNKFNIMTDMYGEEEKDVVIRKQEIQLLQEYSVPNKSLESQDYMEQVRRCFSLNVNMPGTLEMEHPNKFIKDLRPIEEFRNTPLIPISERQMREFKERVDIYHRKGFYFEVKSETIINYALVAITSIFCFQMIRFVLNKEEQAGIALERIQITRQNQLYNQAVKF